MRCRSQTTCWRGASGRKARRRFVGFDRPIAAEDHPQLQQAPTSTLPQQLAAERDQFVANLFHANGDEGLKAFIEKRAPRFE